MFAEYVVYVMYISAECCVVIIASVYNFNFAEFVVLWCVRLQFGFLSIECVTF